MSAFTRLYYANRGLGGLDRHDCYDHPFEDTFHDPPVPIVPEDPYGEPAPTLYGRGQPAAEMRHFDPRYAARNRE